MPYRIYYHRVTDAANDVRVASNSIKEKLGLSGGGSYADVRAVIEGIAKSKKLTIVEQDDKASGAALKQVFLTAPGPKSAPDLVCTVNTSQAHVIYYTPFPCMYMQCEDMFQRMAGYAVEMHLPPTKPLAKYGAHSIFYVVGHGDRTAGLVTCDCGSCGEQQFEGNGLGPWALWERMKGDGIPANATAIRLWVCLGGNAPPDNNRGEVSFAAAFTMAVEADEDYLSERTSIQSYTGFLTMTRDGGRSYVTRADETTAVRAAMRLVSNRKGSVEQAVAAAAKTR